MMEGWAAKCRTSWKKLGILLTVPVFVLLLLLGASGAEAQSTEKIHGVDGAPGVGDPYYPRLGNSGYDVKHYDVELRIDPARRFVKGSTSIELVPTDTLRTFTLDLTGLNVGSVKVDGVPASFEHLNKKLQVEPQQPLAEDRTAVVSVTCKEAAAVVIPDGLDLVQRWRRAVFAAAIRSGDSLSSNDHPSDKATFDFDLTTRRAPRLVANGLPSELPAPGPGLTRVAWSEPNPFPTYAAVVAVGRFQVVQETGPDGLPIINAFPPEEVGKLTRRLARQGEIVSVLEDYFGPYPYSSIGAIVTPESRADAMEAASRPTYPGVKWALNGKDFEQVVAHEIAHQWLGNAVSFESWRDIWLSEGFATYGELLWISHKRGVPIETLFEGDSNVFGYYRSMKKVPPGDPGRNRLFDISVYNRGALTLEALRRTVGDETFYEILRAYIDRYRGANATTEDFISLSESISGQDLESFFDRWLYKKGTSASAWGRIRVKGSNRLLFVRS